MIDNNEQALGLLSNIAYRIDILKGNYPPIGPDGHDLVFSKELFDEGICSSEDKDLSWGEVLDILSKACSDFKSKSDSITESLDIKCLGDLSIAVHFFEDILVHNRVPGHPEIPNHP